MDDHNFMDDLFGDGEPVNIPPPAIINGLFDRLDDMAGSNCSQKLAWSKFGVVACIAPSQRAVDLYVLIRSPKRATWSLSRPVTLSVPLDEHHELVHLAWNYVGSELAAVDSCGRIFVFQNHSSMGRMHLLRSGVGDPDNELHALAALHWLPVAPYQETSGTVWSATRQEASWSYKIAKSLAATGAFNPQKTRTALLALSKCGLLRLLYQNAEGQFQEKVLELDIPLNPLDYSFSHAAFAPLEGQRLLLATYDNSRALRAYSVDFVWVRQANKQAQEQDQKPQLNPNLDVTPMAVHYAVAPTQNSSEAGHVQTPYALSRLEFIPVIPDPSKSDHPSIIAVFSVAVNSPLSMHTGQYPSVVCKWDLKKGPAFKPLPNIEEMAAIRKVQLPSRYDYVLERQPDIPLHAYVLSFSVLRNESLLCFGLSDGSVQFRVRESMEIAAPNGDKELKSLPQVGFSFPVEPPETAGLHIVLSPNNCCAVTMNAEGEVRLKLMEFLQANLETIKEDDPAFGPVSAIFTTYCVTSWMSYQGTDDLFAMLPKNTSKDLRDAIVEQNAVAANPLGAVFDFVAPESTQQAVHAMYKVRFGHMCLSNNLALFLGQQRFMPTNARLSWIVLNLRVISINIQGVINPRSIETFKPEIAASFAGPMRWVLDLFALWLQDLSDLHYELKSKTDDLLALTKYIRKLNTPCIHMILCSAPRFLLRHVSKMLRMALGAIRDNLKKAPDGDPAKEHWRRLNASFAGHPIYPLLYRMAALDQYFLEVEKAVRECYAAQAAQAGAGGAGTAPARRAATERGMLFRCELPAFLAPAISALIRGAVGPLLAEQEGVDRGSLFKQTIALLGMSAEDARLAHGEPVVDVVRKWPMGAAKKAKRCARCGSATEDAEAPAAGAPWLASSLRHCVCFNNWIVLEEAGVKK